MARNDDCLPVVEQHSRYRKEFLKSLTEEERCLCSRKIPRASFLSSAKSPWRNLLVLQVNQALITMTSFDGVQNLLTRVDKEKSAADLFCVF